MFIFSRGQMGQASRFKILIFTILGLFIAGTAYIAVEHTQSQSTAPKSLADYRKNIPHSKNHDKKLLKEYVSRIHVLFDGKITGVSQDNGKTIVKYQVVKPYKGLSGDQKIVTVEHDSSFKPDPNQDHVYLVESYKWSDGELHSSPENTLAVKMMWPEGEQSIRKYFK